MLSAGSAAVSPFPAGCVSLIGAGPGDPELLTLKAFHRLQQAEVLLYDNLVSPEILAWVPSTVERLFVGKMPGNHTLSQDEIGPLMLEKVRSGRRVVRLKGGDPFVFGRGGEEMEALLAAGIGVEIVPGITAALGAAAAFGFPLTHREHAQSCLFVTGHLKDHSVDLNWPALAQPRQTLAIYMGMTGIDTISRELQTHGLPGDTPAVLVFKATWPEQKLHHATLATLPQVVREQSIKSPTLLVIGSVVSLSLHKHSV